MPLPSRLSILPLVAILALAVSPAARAEDTPRTITVTATGEAAADPDMATVSAGVVAQAKTARDALTANSKSMRNVVDGLKALGIEPRDIQTRNFGIQPDYVTPERGQPPRIDGYRVHNEVVVTVRDLKGLGGLLDQLVDLGANQIGSIAFAVSKAETLADDARKTAVANAVRRAKLYAEAAGVKLGKVVTIAEQSAGGPRPYAMGRVAMSEAAPPIESGTEILSVTVSVTFELD